MSARGCARSANRARSSRYDNNQLKWIYKGRTVRSDGAAAARLFSDASPDISKRYKDVYDDILSGDQEQFEPYLGS